jgi:hypothetical protein
MKIIRLNDQEKAALMKKAAGEYFPTSNGNEPPLEEIRQGGSPKINRQKG